MQWTGWADATSELDRNQAQQTNTKQKQAWTLEVVACRGSNWEDSEITAIRSESRKDIAITEVMVI